MKILTVPKMVALSMFANTIGYGLYWVIFVLIVPTFLDNRDHMNYMNNYDVHTPAKGVINELCVLIIMSVLISIAVRDVRNDLDKKLVIKRIVTTNVILFVLFYFMPTAIFSYTLAHPLAFTFLGVENRIVIMGVSPVLVLLLNIFATYFIYSFIYKATAPEREMKLNVIKEREEAAAAALKALGD